LWAGTAAQAAAVTMKNEVGGDRVGRRRELAGSEGGRWWSCKV